MKSLISSVKNAVSVPLKFHWSVLILPFLLIFYNGVAMGIPLFILLFGSLLFHEYSHVWMAQRQGLYVPYVITHGFGAAAMIHEPDPSNFKRNMKVAGVGPLSSFMLFGLGVVLHMLFHSVWTLYFVYINFLLGAFNLLPLFPSDGGRILYSLLGMKYGGFKAIRGAVYTSWVLCGLGCLYALWAGSWWLLAVLILLTAMSIQEKKVTEARLNGYDVTYQ
jgi:Zn-dependent protease